MISIIVPNYNHSFVLPLVLRGYNNFPFSDDEVEMVIVDDCSSEPFKEILVHILKYVKPWFKVRVFETNERTYGPTLPFNIGVKKCHGDIIILNPADIVPTTEVLPIILREHKKISNLYLMPKLYINMHGTEWQKTTCGVSMKKKSYEDVGGYDERFKGIGRQDLDFLARFERGPFIVKTCREAPPNLVYMHIEIMTPTDPKKFYFEENGRLLQENTRKGIIKVNPDGWGELDTLEEVDIARLLGEN